MPGEFSKSHHSGHGFVPFSWNQALNAAALSSASPVIPLSVLSMAGRGGEWYNSVLCN